MATGSTIALCLKDIENKRDTLYTKTTEGFGLTAVKTLESVTNAINSISVADLGEVSIGETDEKSYSAGYYKAFTVKGSSAQGNYRLQDKTVTLTEADLKNGVTIDNDASDSGGLIYGLNLVKINPVDTKYFNYQSTDVTPEDVIDGATFVDPTTGEIVEGTMPNNGDFGDNTLDTTKTTITIPEGYTEGGTVSISLETKNVTPSTSQQIITPSSGKLLSQVTVAAIPVATAVTASIDGLTTTEVTIPAGHYTTNSKVTFDDSAILSALQAI